MFVEKLLFAHSPHMKPRVCHRLVTVSWHHYYALWDVLWIVSFGDCSSLAADETFPHAARKEKVMVPICTMQRWVTERDGVRRSNINFSANTPTTCQAAEKVQYLKGWVEGKVLFHRDGGVQNGQGLIMYKIRTILQRRRNYSDPLLLLKDLTSRRASHCSCSSGFRMFRL